MTTILGISALYHDSAAALMVEGRVVAAAQEERFSRRKHDAALPVRAVDYCLREAGLTAGELDYVAFYEKPLLKFERLLETYLAFAPRGLGSFCHVLPSWLHEKLFIPGEIRRALGGEYRKRCIFARHHEAHAASAFFPSPFDEAAVLTLDGVGEWSTATLGYGRGNRLTLTHEQRFPHSLGLLYSAFTQFCGFRVNSGEYKLMGLAPYGQPRYTDLILEEIIDLKPDGSLRLGLSYFDYCHGLRMTSRKFERLFGGPPRQPEAPITEREMDLAASIQQVTEEAMLRAARHAHRLTGSKNLCLAGGVALNAVGNGRIVHEGPFENVWIQPASGDAGGALGAAWLVWHQLLGRPREPSPCDSLHASLLGPRYGEDEIRRVFGAGSARYKHFSDEHAGLRFLLAKAYDAAGRLDEARREYLAAKELDICPLRILEPMNEAILEIAHQTPTPLIDIRQAYEQLCPDGIPGSFWLIDHVHPSIAGHQFIADRLAEAMIRCNFLRPQPGWRERAKAAHREHVAGLDPLYFEKGVLRLEVLCRWTRGESTTEPLGRPPHEDWRVRKQRAPAPRRRLRITCGRRRRI